MQAVSVALWIYLLTIVFALFIAGLIRGLGWFVGKLGLDRDEPIDISVPSADSLREQEMMAVAIAVAHARNKH